MTNLSNPFRQFFASERAAGLLLLVCTVLSLLLANSGAGEGYRGLLHVKAGAGPLRLTLEQWINDGLMAVFFLLVGLEVKRELYAGELADLSSALFPVAAAIGGMIVPSLLHFLVNRGGAGSAGFAIPMATDIAFALGVLSLAGSRVPPAVKVFLSALAIIDDIGAILVIAFFYTAELNGLYLLGGIGVFGLLLLFNRLRVRTPLLYFLPGIVLWYCFLRSGVHPTVSGVLLAFALPFDRGDEQTLSLRVQRFLHGPVAYFILPLFALANTAILLPADLRGAVGSRNSAGIIAGLFIGKPTGILAACWLLVKLRLARLGEGLSWRLLAGAGLLGGIGFTMSMFIANLAFSDGAMVTASRLSILIASAISAIAGLLVFLTSRKAKAVQ